MICVSCIKMFGGTCEIKDWCGDLNQAKKDEAAKAAEEAAEQDANTNDEANNVSFAVMFNGGSDDFEGDGKIPWILGSPAQWEVVDNMAYSGTHSITNIPSQVVSATRSLKTKINLSNEGSIECRMKLDIGMPFDRFSFHVNDEQRNVFYQPVEGWATIAADLPSGDNTLEFRVTNGDMFPDFSREEMSVYGSGHVWIDQCDIVVN